jgi:hypothetical protein
MLLGCPWLQNAKVTHDRRNNLISIEGNGIINAIVVTKHLDNNTKRPEVLLCNDFVNKITNKKEDMLLATKLDVFTIGTITLQELGILGTMSNVKTSMDAKIDTNAKIGINVEIKMNPKIDIDTNMKIDIDEQFFDFLHTLREISSNTTPI